MSVATSPIVLWSSVLFVTLTVLAIVAFVLLVGECGHGIEGSPAHGVRIPPAEDAMIDRDFEAQMVILYHCRGISCVARGSTGTAMHAHRTDRALDTFCNCSCYQCRNRCAEHRRRKCGR